MGINLGNTAFGSLYLGGTKIAEVYKGSTKIFAIQTGMPAKSLKFRFSNASFTPSTTNGTWTKVTGSQYNDWIWTYNATSWASGLGASEFPSFQIIEAGDLSGITSFSYLFSQCRYLTQDAGEILAIIAANMSGSPSMDHMFSCTGIGTCSSWPSNVSSCNCTRMFANCYNLNNPGNIYSWANAKSCTTTNIVAMAGLNKSAGRTSVSSVASSAGGGSTQSFTNGYWNRYKTVSFCTSSGNRNLVIRFPWFSNALRQMTGASGKQYTCKLSSRHSVSFTQYYVSSRSILKGCFSYKGQSPTSTDIALNAVIAFFQVDSSGITWASSGYSIRAVDSGRTKGTFALPTEFTAQYVKGTFDTKKPTYFGVLFYNTNDIVSSLDIVPFKKFYLPDGLHESGYPTAYLLSTFSLSTSLSQGSWPSDTSN